MKIVCEGSFQITATAVGDDDEDGAALVKIESTGFQASPRGLGFLLGTMVSWYLNKVEEHQPEAASEVERLGLMIEIQRGMAHALRAGEIVQGKPS